VHGDTQAFIVRVWHEAEDDEGHLITWRGSIQHVGSDKRYYFQDLNGIVRFIREQTGMNIRRKGSKWKSLLARTRRGTS
jgi:hypothetical protein